MLPKFPFWDLHSWYQKNGRHDLPWRDYDFDEKTLGYRVWLAETMLQQTQVERVKSYFENILETFPTVEDLAACSYEDFFPYYKGLGYYSRARNMLRTAKTVVDDFDGIFPKGTENLRKLAGVWPYTAEAIRAFAYDIPTLSFDTNLEKIFSRYYHGNKFQKLTKEEKEDLLEQMKEFCEKSPHTSLQLSPTRRESKLQSFPSPGRRGLGRGVVWAGFSRDINNALMDYGATISLNNISGIDWENYPFPESKFYQTRWKLEPVKEKKKSSFPTRSAFVICILHENHKKYYSSAPTNISSHHEQPSYNFLPMGEMKPQPSSPNGRGDSEVRAWGFTPFLIWKNLWNPRAQIQSYFLEEYWLELSVRPPEVKSYKHETPYLVCYAQIQSGAHNFEVFENMRLRGFEESLVENLDFWESLSLF